MGFLPSIGKKKDAAAEASKAAAAAPGDEKAKGPGAMDGFYKKKPGVKDDDDDASTLSGGGATVSTGLPERWLPAVRGPARAKSLESAGLRGGVAAPPRGRDVDIPRGRSGRPLINERRARQMVRAFAGRGRGAAAGVRRGYSERAERTKMEGL